MLIVEIKIILYREIEIVGQELYRIENFIRDFILLDKLFEDFCCCFGLDDFGMFFWLMLNIVYLEMFKIFFKMVIDEVQCNWMGNLGIYLFK